MLPSQDPQQLFLLLILIAAAIIVPAVVVADLLCMILLLIGQETIFAEIIQINMPADAANLASAAILESGSHFPAADAVGLAHLIVSGP